MRRFWRSGLGFSTFIVAALLVAALVVGFTYGSGKSAASSSPTTSTVGAGTVSQAVIQALTVKTVSVSCPDIVNANGGSTKATGGQTVVVYDVGALKGVPPREWSDALSTPLPGSNPQQQLAALQASICEDPLLGATWANMFAGLQVGNVSVGSLNPWLSPFAGDASGINATAAGYIPLLDVTSPTQAQAAAAVDKNVAWQQVAEKIDTLLGRFLLVGVQSPASVQNWHLAAGGLVVGGLPAVELNSAQESLPALVLEVTEKGACAPLKVIGANVGDQRPEVFATPTCAAPPPTPAATAPPGTSPKPTAPPATSPSPTSPKPTVTVPSTRVTTPTTPVTTVPYVPTCANGGLPASECHSTTTVPYVPTCENGGLPYSKCHSTTTVTSPPGCTSGKCHPPVTVAPSPVTAAPSSPTTVQPVNGGHGDSGPGAYNTVPPASVPTTVAQPVAPPITSPPTTAAGDQGGSNCGNAGQSSCGGGVGGV